MQFMVSILLIYLLYLTKGMTKKSHHHGGAVCHVQRNGYSKLANTLAVAALEGVGRGRCCRVLFDYVNWLRKKN
jgi:hypothetical protein